MSTSSEPARILLVIGGTGAQGMPVIRALLQPTTDGKPSPWAVRIITRDPTHRRAKELEALGVEIYKGSFHLITRLLGTYCHTREFLGL